MPDVERAELVERTVDLLAAGTHPDDVEKELPGGIRALAIAYDELRAAQAGFVNTHRHASPVSARTLIEEATEHEDEADFASHPFTTEALPAEMH